MTCFTSQLPEDLLCLLCETLGQPANLGRSSETFISSLSLAAQLDC